MNGLHWEVSADTLENALRAFVHVALHAGFIAAGSLRGAVYGPLDSVQGAPCAPGALGAAMEPVCPDAFFLG